MVIVLSGRSDWFARLPVIVALGSISWGIGGIMSYGIVVGYGHAGDYLNVSYGLMMLLVIGGLYGFLGGGITGLALESSSGKKIDWAALFTQLFVGGYLCWGLLINELEWLMTPPRSEMWAACLGASLALGWYLFRNGYKHALRTACFSALGAGFGFGAGNFFQRMGAASGVDFNWWNVMEYSIGFFGGLGMAYGVFSGGHWPKGREADKGSNMAGWIFLLILLPSICLVEGVNTKTMTGMGKRLLADDPASFALNWQWISWILSLVCMILTGWIAYRYHFRARASVQKQGTSFKKIALTITMLYLAWYILISNIIGATWLTAHFSSQHLYWANLLVLYFLLRGKTAAPATDGLTADMAADADDHGNERPYWRTLLTWWAFAILSILLLSYIAISCSPASAHVQLRF
ncbi:MAG: hypothetical protein Q8939_11035 [Bacteroidota bacterium]|nr:hypothetical protein [Bacteroidota bacterium]MDP4212775.1 hypothetical protein [Bacteroidota bacterium]